jgi:N4-gp56 family major capsid protein
VPNAYTDTTAVSNLVTAAYDRYVHMALRAQPLIRSVADQRPVQQAMPGSSVIFSFYQDLAPVTNTLQETVDPDAVAIGNTTQVSVTLEERGNAAIATRRLQLFSLSDVDPAIADLIAFNMADSLDAVAMDKLRQGTNVIRSGNKAATNTVTAADTLKSADVRKTVAKLRANKAVPREGALYWAGIHPEVSHDLRAETGAGGWRDAHTYTEQGVGNLWPGTIGTYEGAFFVETPRMFTATDGASGAKVYRTIVCGKQALAEAVAEEPHVIVGPVTDKLMRFRPIGWRGTLGFSLFRQEALFRIESGSSIA